MEQLEKEDKLLKSLMKHSRVELPFQDFEIRLMDKIHQEKKHHQAVKNNVRYAWLFFFLGLFLGLFITNLTTQFDQHFYGIPLKKLAIGLQFGIVLIFLFQFERLLGITFRKKTKN